MIGPRAIGRAFVAGCLVALAAVAAWHYRPTAALAQARQLKPIDWNERDIKWHSLDEGLQEAKRTGAPILALFYTDWCPYCMAHSRLFRDAEIVELSRSLVMVKVNRDKAPDINARYAPDGGYVPRTMILKPDGSLAAAIHGADPTYKYLLDYETKAELVAVMRKAVSQRLSLAAPTTPQR
jgi:thiol-disulfide isomerase/thioredoxin